MISDRSLTVRQQAIYNYLVERIHFERICPSIREIGEQFGIRSPNGVQCHLRALRQKGLIEREEAGQARNIRLLQVPHPMFSMIGSAPGGIADPRKPKKTARRKNAKPRFTLAQVQDDSLKSQDILRGDWVAFENRGRRQRPVALFRRFSDQNTFTLSFSANKPIDFSSAIPSTGSALLPANS